MSRKPLKKSDLDKPWVRNNRARRVREERRYILIASEDEKSSVYYFDEFSKRIAGNAARVCVLPKGIGMSTLSLVDHVHENVGKWLKELNNDYDVDKFDDVWILFDKDDFRDDDFDNAIKKAESYGYHTAWSNECFELWYLLHLKYQTTGIARRDIFEQMKPLYSGDYDYEKTLKGRAGEEFHREMAHHEKQSTAIKRARRLLEQYDSDAAPHTRNPCTMVHSLVEFLLKYVTD